MSKITEAYERGLADGRRMKPTLAADMEWTVKWGKLAYPATRDLDYWKEVVEFDRERLRNPPDPIRYPETRGLPDIVAAERKGFAEGSGGGERELAFQYTWFFYCSRRLNTRYVGTGIRANHCTAVYIRDTKEGGPLYGRNLDVNRRPDERFDPPTEGPGRKRERLVSGVSSAALCDEEPDEIFPVDVWSLMPKDCRKVRDIISFLQRYTPFWGPQNGILVDEEQDSVAYEKSNCRMGVRYSDDGTAAVTACSYLIPEMKAFKEKCSRRSLELRGWDETSPDWLYWQGCDRRYERLLKLTRETARKGATLDDMVKIVTDHAVPFPDRVCLAGEKGHPDDPDVNWTVTSFSSVMEGPNRRTLWSRVEGQKACYDTQPFLVLGDGVEMKPEWRKGTRGQGTA